ncbi:MAG: 30S ribosomal protein S20 [Planctomycetes bacterium]|nr:30S ribosomal protein S20 [Planctomycetota bacterium]
MAHSISARKRIRQNNRRTLQNRGVKSEIKTRIKKLAEVVAQNNAEAAQAIFLLVVSKIDKAKKNEIIHRNKAARLKSKLAVLMNKLKGQPVSSAS